MESVYVHSTHVKLDLLRFMWSEDWVAAHVVKVFGCVLHLYGIRAIVRTSVET